MAPTELDGKHVDQDCGKWTARDWVDVVAKLLLPLVIAVIGGIYTYLSHKGDVERLSAESTATLARLRFDRDARYTEMLIEGTPQKKHYAIAIIADFSRRNNLSPEVNQVLQQLCDVEESADLKADACAALARRPKTSVSTAVASVPHDALPVKVTVELANDNQRNDAKILQAKLREKGYDAKEEDQEVLPAASSSFNTYVRTFSPKAAAAAESVRQIMVSQGYQSVAIQYLSPEGQESADGIEIWIGKRQTKGH